MKWNATALPKIKDEDFIVLELYIDDKDDSVGYLFLKPSELADFEKKLLEGKAKKWQQQD